MLSNLHTLSLANIRAKGPTIPELLFILKASPGLSSLLLRDVAFQPHIPQPNLPGVDLRQLTDLTMAWLTREDIETLLSNIRSSHCQTLFVGCFLDVDTDIISVTTAIPPFLPVPPHEVLHATPPDNLTIDPECLDFSVHFTPQHRARFWFDTKDVAADAIILRLLAILPHSTRNRDTEIALWTRYSMSQAVAIPDAANMLHVTSLTLISYEWKIDGVVEHLSHERVFPELRELHIAISGVSPGVLASTVQARYGPGGTEQLAQLIIGDARPHHDRDREIVEAVVGSDRLIWSQESFSWEEPAIDI